MNVELKTKRMLEDGYAYNKIAKETGLSTPQIMRRKRKYCINLQTGFMSRLKRDGIPNRSPKNQEFCAWFVGFFDGEGTFQFWHRNKPNKQKQFGLQLTAGLRDDDSSVFDYITSEVGGNYTPYTPKQGTSNPSVRWVIERVDVLQEVFIPIFDKFKLRSKKLPQFELWKQFVLEKYINTLGGKTTFKYDQEFTTRFLQASEQIKQLRSYDVVSGFNDHTSNNGHVLQTKRFSSVS